MGKIFTLSGPRGVGKTSIINGLHDNYDIKPIVPLTTRDPRADEEEGREYFFVTEAEFDAVRHTKGMFDVLTVGDKKYGTPLEEFENVINSPDGSIDSLRTVNLAAASALELRRQMGKAAVKSIFVLPRSWGDIEQQMRDKGIPENLIMERRAVEPTDLTMLPEFNRLIINEYGDMESGIQETASYIGKVIGRTLSPSLH